MKHFDSDPTLDCDALQRKETARKLRYRAIGPAAAAMILVWIWAESAYALTRYGHRSFSVAVEAVKIGQPLLGVRMPAVGQLLRGVRGSVGGRGVAFSPSAISALEIRSYSHWLVTGSWDGAARLWDLTAKDPTSNPIVLRGHQDAVNTVGISPDNRWVVTGSLDKTARLWDLTAKNPTTSPIVLRGHDDAVNAVGISPDSHWVVTGSLDKTARLWDLTAKNPTTSPIVLRGHEGTVYAVEISPDNRWLVTGSWDGTARLWDLNAKDPAASSIVLRSAEGVQNSRRSHLLASRQSRSYFRQSPVTNLSWVHPSRVRHLNGRLAVIE